MELVIEGGRIPIKMWVKNCEDGAIDQAKNLSNLPFAFKHIALMPDCHQGYGMPIGGVMATRNVVVPNAVGVDIGCGMCAVKTSILASDVTTEHLKRIIGGSSEYKGGIRAKVPVGMNSRNKPVEWDGFSGAPFDEVVFHELNTAQKQLGTLGSGNHFIEIQKDESGFVWIMIHSGSRHLGYTIAKHYNALAQALCSKWHSNIPAFNGEDGLAFLPVDTQEGHAYIQAMNFALKFALQNRTVMMDECKNAVRSVFPEVMFDEMINIHHNYASLENHFGKNVWVHRKGATSARVGEIGIIPGSQGTKSYIVEGLGNEQSFMSCSHGAGRNMSRTRAINELSLEKEQKILDDLGVVHSLNSKSSLDEAPSAYKDIDEVMKNQHDLVKILHELTPMAVVKG